MGAEGGIPSRNIAVLLSMPRPSTPLSAVADISPASGETGVGRAVIVPNPALRRKSALTIHLG
ncbi:hypothetical protein SAMN05444272_1182 [Roseibium suaedae]|uniref:Uncharacterized protein n=1 Tax=Roseibium suaedae TaxID=735517 RepID=A0A1M7CJF2_9HYPH|nr:hypothetical protein SAMN05444272_1182 [Roseibium suaedae]